MKNKKYNLKNIKKFNRKSNSLYVKFLLLPLVTRLSLFFLNYTKLNPINLSFIGLFFGIISAFFFYSNQNIYAALFFQISVIFDLIDGLVARARKEQSVKGILSDCYIDIIVTTINALAIILGNSENNLIAILMSAYLVLHYIESWIDFAVFAIFKHLKQKKNIILDKLDFFLIKIKNILEKKKLRLIFFYYQERYLFIFVLGPILDKIEIFLLITLIMTFVMINLKVIFDISLIKYSLVKRKKESFKFRDTVTE